MTDADFTDLDEWAAIIAAGVMERLGQSTPPGLTAEERELVDRIVDAIREELAASGPASDTGASPTVSGSPSGADEVLNADRVDVSALAEPGSVAGTAQDGTTPGAPQAARGTGSGQDASDAASQSAQANANATDHDVAE